MEGVTLMESGTNRSHFAFIKRLEAAKSAGRADESTLSTIAEVQKALMSKSTHSWSSFSLTSHLLLLLHCIDLFPSSNDIRLQRPSIQFALLPALHLSAIAKRPKELYIAYAILGKLLEAQTEEEQRQTSLLLLNTVRQHLESTLSNSSGSNSRSRQYGEQSKGASDPIGLAKTSLALKSIISGVPAGPDIFPALFSPISQLCHHPDEGIQRLALDALGKIQSYLDHDEGLARAIWERVRGLLKSYGSKHSGKSKATSVSLGRALLRATRRAVDQGVIGGEAACESAFALIDVQDSPTLSIACLDFCIDMAERKIIEQVTMERIWMAAGEICLLHPSSYSVLLSSARILGKLASLQYTPSSLENVKPIWSLIKSHLFAKNANRKLFLLSTLESFLPFSWFDEGNAAGIELQESEMTSLMAMLGDKDESIRLRSLSLFYRINSGLLDAHLQQLMAAASKTEENGLTERRELCLRALEVASIRHISEEVKRYSSVVNDILAIPSDNSIDDGLIRSVLNYLRAADAPYGSRVLLQILQKQHNDDLQSSPTLTLLSASLACELEYSTAISNEVLHQLVTMVVHLSGQAALLEALLIGMTKLILCHSDGTVDIHSSLSKASESNSSPVVQHRIEQIREVLREANSSATSLIKLPNGSLLDTMDRLDAYFMRKRTSPATEQPAAAPVQQFKPLHYEAYDEGNILSPSSSTSASKPYSALPTPSLAQDSRTRRQQKQKEDQVRMEMQKSIARLTMDTEYSDEDKGEKSSNGKEKNEDVVLF